MSRRSRRRPPDRDQSLRPDGGSGPSLLELERFSRSSLKQWQAAAFRLHHLHGGLHFGLEALRKAHGAALLAALKFAARSGFRFDGWSRIVDYQFSLAPLSVAGSLKGEGGRFNIGAGLAPDAFTPFPALYIAEDYATAGCEKFGVARSASKLSAPELALRRPNSFTQVRLHGYIDAVLDIADLNALKPFADVLRTFALPKPVSRLARQLNLRRAPALIHSPAALQRQLLTPDWRVLPLQFDLPSNSQVFARIAVAAGLQALLYPSSRAAGGRCLALFPQNWRGTASFVELTDRAPADARLTRVDQSTAPLE